MGKGHSWSGTYSQTKVPTLATEVAFAARVPVKDGMAREWISDE
jgi:hypothetical protein